MRKGPPGRVPSGGRALKALANAAVALSHPALNVLACLANVLGEPRALLYASGNLLAFPAICLCGVTDCVTQIGSHRLPSFRRPDQLSPQSFDFLRCGLIVSHHGLGGDPWKILDARHG